MTGNKYLVDTNIISAYFGGDNSVKNKFDIPENIFIPVIVIGELTFGAALSTKASKNLKGIERTIDTFNVLNVNIETCKHYGTIKASLRKKGTPIPENDIWIAAIALQHNLILVTRDNHFKEVDGLMMETW